MKAILEFNLPEDKEEFKLANQATSYYLVIEDIDNYLRSRIKYEQNSEEVEKVLQEVREKLYEIISENNLSI